jgi:hypothetical protein
MLSIPELARSSSLVFSGTVMKRSISTVPTVSPNDKLLTGKPSLPGGVGEWDEKCVVTSLIGNAAMTSTRRTSTRQLSSETGGHCDRFSARR